jgi:hypothetical protein
LHHPVPASDQSLTLGTLRQSAAFDHEADVRVAGAT